MNPFVETAELSAILLGHEKGTTVYRFFLLIKRPGKIGGKLLDMEFEEILDLIDEPVLSIA